MNTQSNLSKTPLLLSAIFFCIFLSVFLFLHKLVINNNERSQLKEKEWQNEAFRRDEIKALNRSIETVKEEKARLETHFAQSSDIVPFLDTIEELGRKVDAKAEFVSVDILKDGTGLMVSMKASGVFQALYKFITLLENSPYELEFIEMNMRRGTEPNSANNKNVSVSKWDATFKIKLLSFVK